MSGLRSEWKEPAELVVRSFDKLQLLQWHADALQHRFDDLFIVLHPELQQLPGGLHVV